MDDPIKRSIGALSTRNLLLFLFSFLLLVTIALTSFLLINSGNRIIDDVIAKSAETISRDLSREVTRFLQTPDIVNLNGARSILAGRLDYSNDDSIAQFFMDAPQRQAEYSVSSMYFAEPTGRFIGVEVGGYQHDLDSWNISISSNRTNGIYTDYEVNSNGRVGEKIGEVRLYDPRVRPWYISAIATPDRPIWTDVYTDFNTNLATLTRAQAVVGERGELIGVLAVDLFLEHIQNFLSSLDMSKNSEAFIINSDGLVLAAHAPGYTGDLPTHNLLAPDSPLKFTPSAVELLMVKSNNTTGTTAKTFSDETDRATTVSLKGEDGYLHSSSIGYDSGVDWTIGVYIPHADFLQSVNEHMLKLIPPALVGLLLIGAVLRVFLSLVIRPIEALRENAKKIAAGNFNTNIDISIKNEVGELARSIDIMQKSLHTSFTEIELNNQTLSNEKSRAESTLGSISDGVISINNDKKLLYMNPAALHLTGHVLSGTEGEPVEQVLNIRPIEKSDANCGDNFYNIFDTEVDTEIQDLELLDKSNNSRPISFRITPIINEGGLKIGSVIVISDLTEKVQMTSELMYQATHDDLTGLINRREFERLLDRSLQEDRKAPNTDTILYLDLDQFKLVNDTCGHLAGDELLRQIAETFKQNVRMGDLVARLGGDEFGILLKHCSNDNGMLIAQKIISSLEKYRFDWEQRTFRVGVSIGLLSIDSPGLSVGTVLRDVDSACYIAKERGRNRIHPFNKNDEPISHKRNEILWVDRIEQAIESNSFVLYAQKIIPTHNNLDQRLHFEVLARMMNDRGELLPPGSFFPAAERYNLSSKIDQWIIENTFRWLNTNRRFVSDMGICFINMSAQSICDSRVATFVIQQLDKYDIASDRICFEVTETATIANLSTTVRVMDELRSRGCLFGLDDFGTGLSSFEYLKNLNVDYLKIDGVFIRDIISNDYDEVIVSSINKIGKSLGLLTVAESVETIELVEKLGKIGIDFVQGYGVSRPHHIDDLLDIKFRLVA